MTVQLTIFADGIGRVKPLVVFKGKGLCIGTEEKKMWDTRVDVVFQDNAWVDERIFLWWMENAWKTCRSSIFDIRQKLLTLDMYKGQNTETIQNAWKKYRTTPVIIPAGCTSLIQPLDVSVNKSFKQYVEESSQQYYVEHTENWIEGKISAKERRILMTKWWGKPGIGSAKTVEILFNVALQNVALHYRMMDLGIVKSILKVYRTTMFPLQHYLPVPLVRPTSNLVLQSYYHRRSIVVTGFHAKGKTSLIQMTLQVIQIPTTHPKTPMIIWKICSLENTFSMYLASDRVICSGHDIYHVDTLTFGLSYILGL